MHDKSGYANVPKYLLYTAVLFRSGSAGKIIMLQLVHQILAYYAWPRNSSTKVTRKENKSVTSARSPRNTSAQL